MTLNPLFSEEQNSEPRAPLVARNALSSRVIAVNGADHPTSTRSDPGIYAVFASKAPSWENGDFLGYVTDADISQFPLRSFAELAHSPHSEPADHDASLETVLKKMRDERTETLCVSGSGGKCIGILTLSSILDALLRRESTLLDQTSRLQALLKFNQEQSSRWSVRLIELLAASRMLLNLLSNTTIEENLLQAGIEAICKLIQAKYGAIGVFDGNGGLAHFFHTGMSETEAKKISHLPEGRGLLGVVVDEDIVIRLDNMENDPRRAGFPEHHPKMKSLLAVPISNFGRMYGRIYLCDRIDGSPFSAEDEVLTSNFAHSLSLILDNAKEINNLRQAQESLTNLANHDAVTGLPNRKLFDDRLEFLISHTARSQTQIAILFLALDNFKTINDTLGHRVSDQLLIAMGKILTDCMREGDTVAHIAGDKFVLIMADLASPEHAAVAAQKIIDSVAQPVIINGTEIVVSASLGIAVYPTDGVTADSLVKNADIAMHKTKQKGRKTCCFFTEDMNFLARQRIEMEKSLKRAIEQNEFSLHYQPRIDLSNGKLVGVEALLRWKNPDGVSVPPATFIPVAEESGLIAPIGHWVLETACRMGKAWQDAGFPELTMSVNLSVRQLWKRNFTRTLGESLLAAGFAPQYLDLEITESALMHDTELSSLAITELKKMGTGISIDDFGTGYSSLSYLKHFKVDCLKIHPSLVRNIDSQNDMSMSGAIIAMAHKLGIKVIAEGVETGEQREFLVAAGCDQAQGYLFSRPIPPEALDILIRQRASPEIWLPGEAHPGIT